MSGEAVIIGEVLVAIINAWALKARMAGMTEEQIAEWLTKAEAQVRASKPEALPDV